MKKTLALVVAASLVSASVTAPALAEDGSAQPDGREIAYRFSPEFWAIDQLLRENLSETEIAEIRKVYDGFNKLLLERSTVAISHCKLQLEGELNGFYQSLSKYVDPAKTYAFREYVIRNSSPQDTQSSNLIGYTKCTVNLEKAYRTKPLLNDRLKASIDSKIDSVPVSDRLRYAEKLVKYLRKVQSKTQNSRTKRLATEMIAYLEGKMDEIEGLSLFPVEFEDL